MSDGLNCISLAHLIIRDLFGYVLPATYQCPELSTDQEHFMFIPSASLMRPGDLVWLGVADPAASIEDFVPRFENGRLANFHEYPINHVAIYTGVYDHGDYLLIRANQADQTNTVWPLRAFEDHDRYRKVYAITRLRPNMAAVVPALGRLPAPGERRRRRGGQREPADNLREQLRRLPGAESCS